MPKSAKGRAIGREQDCAGRRLMYFPIIHLPADLGGLSEPVKRLKVGQLGRRGWARNVERIGQLWSEIEQAITGLPICYERLRIYQDGLPECGREREMVAELAQAGSRNHQLLLELQARGAAIMGTESPELLVEEYQLMTKAFAAGDRQQTALRQARRPALGDALLERRDRYIAGRINRTLGPGETGILFLGMWHSVAGLLDPDIQVVFPLQEPFHTGGKR